MTRTGSSARQKPPRLWLDVDETDPAPAAAPPRAPGSQGSLDDEPAPAPARQPRRARRVAALATLVVAAAAVGALAFGGIWDRTGDEAGSLAVSNTGAGTVERAADGVVAIQVDGPDGTASGTGFAIDDEGTLVTNAHVVGDAEEAAVQIGDEGAFYTAEVLGTDPSSDLAVLRLDDDEAEGLEPLELADSDRVELGDRAVAIGHPLGMERTVSEGIVTGLDREIQAPNGFTIARAIQTDARLLPGNSGGPLLDRDGRVIGVASQIAVPPSGLNAQLGFAVPSNTVAEVAPELAAGRQVDHAYLGVSMGTGALGGVAIESTTADGPAAAAGVRAGDVVSAIDGEPVGAADDLSAAVAEREPGDVVELALERSGAEVEVEVELGTQPADAPGLGP